MKRKKFKVGDKVKVKSLSWYIKKCSMNGTVVKSYEDYEFTVDMVKYCGKKATITSILEKGGYHLNIDKGCFFWDDYMLEDMRMAV